MIDNWLNDVASMQILGPRQRQEDSALHVRLGRGRLIVVADGMGGEPAGDTASMAAVLGFEKGFGTPADGFENNMTWAARFLDGLRGALDAMNAAVEAGHGSDGMATTLAAVWADSDGIRWINVGDSGIWGSTTSASAKRMPLRLSERHGIGNWVASGLIAGDGHSSYEQSHRAGFCASKIDLHPGILEPKAGSMVFVASDGIDVLDETHGEHWSQDPYATHGDREQGRMWEDVFRRRNPQQFLAAVEEALASGIAKDNTTAIAIRTSVERMREYGGFKDYVPVSGAPDREVLGPDLPDTRNSRDG